jgi:Flp pilus assembly protein TadG
MDRGHDRGQVLVLFVIGLVAMIAMTGLILDGGAAFAQQRVAQNGSDAAANAGALVIAQSLAGHNETNADVYAAVNGSATTNSLENWTATYTDGRGNALVPTSAVSNDSAAIPAAARGVHVTGDRMTNTSFARVIGINSITASGDATVAAGALSGVCAATDGCSVLPVTFPVSISICDGLGTLINIGDVNNIWPLIDVDQRTAANEAIVPLCKTDSGSVGWLDFGGGNLQQQITTPSNQAFDIPTWLQTQTGDVNAVETAINTYAGKPVLIPLFDGTCRVDPGDASSASTCPADQKGTDPTGNNTWYHIPWFTTFFVDRAYIQGSNVASCASDPGNPKVDPKSPGFLGCIKGWFVQYIYNGPIDPDATIANGASIGIQLIK